MSCAILPPVVLSRSRIVAMHIYPHAETAIVTRVNKCASGVNTGGVMHAGSSVSVPQVVHL